MVNVTRHNANDATRIQLKPNEKLVLLKEAAIKAQIVSRELTAQKATPASFSIVNIDSTKKESERFETAWLYSRLEFRGENFEELARKLERWYNVTIMFTDEAVKQLSFNGSFEKETIEQAFTALKAASAFNYKFSDNEIFIGSFK
jgi:ferric-dicitrate binding protein FerR (iron transport regulator)